MRKNKKTNNQSKNRAIKKRRSRFFCYFAGVYSVREWTLSGWMHTISDDDGPQSDSELYRTGTDSLYFLMHCPQLMLLRYKQSESGNSELFKVPSEKKTPPTTTPLPSHSIPG